MNLNKGVHVCRFGEEYMYCFLSIYKIKLIYRMTTQNILYDKPGLLRTV